MRVVMPQIEPNSINKLDAVAPPTPVQPRPTPAVSAVWGHFLSLLVHRCPLLSESDQITDLAVLPCTLTHSESWSRFRLWWLAWAAVERQDCQRAFLSHGGAN